MALPRRIDCLVLSGTRRLVRPTAGMTHGGKQAAIAGRDDFEAAVPPLHFGARLACRSGGRLAGYAECGLDLIERGRFGRLGIAHALPGSDCFERCDLASVGSAGGERQTNLSISHFEYTADPVLDYLANLPLDESGRKRAHRLVQQVMLRVANAKPERVDLGNNTLKPDDGVRRAFGLLVLGDAGNLDYDRPLTESIRIFVEQGR
jgi:hypothetical protein